MATAKGPEDALARIELIAERLERHQHIRKEYFSVEEAAEFTGLSEVQLNMWRTQTPGGPAHCKVGRRVLYKRADLVAFMDEHRREPMA